MVPAFRSPPVTVGVRLGARGLCRRFGGLLANADIDLSVRPASIHAIAGGNGAGKSTLMRLLQGIERPDQGTVIVNDAPTRFSGPADAFRHGIGMVHQEFMLAPGLTLLENLILGHEPVTALGQIDRKAALAQIWQLEKEAGVELDWDLPVEDAAMYSRQIVEILRLLYRKVDVLILDEPTAILAPAQIRELIALLRRLRDKGRTILFISHKLDEVMAVSDEITILRLGKVVGHFKVAETNKQELGELMIGSGVEPPDAHSGCPGRDIFEMRQVSVTDTKGNCRARRIDLTVRSGEILALAGVAGNGQDQIVAAIAGFSSVATGEILLEGRNIETLPMNLRRRLGLSYLSPDRAGESLCLKASIAENTIIGHHRLQPYTRNGILSLKAILQHVETRLALYSVQYGSCFDSIGQLSGGNQQRVAMARELDGDPSFLLCCQPTRGVDIQGIAFIHRCLLAFRDRGGAILLVSDEIDEIITLADRIAVLYNGSLVGELQRGTGDREAIGRLMLGGTV